MPDVSIVITYYDAPELLKACLKSLDEPASKFSREIIVVDDHSKYLASENVPYKVNIVRNDENLGYVRSNNIGIKTANGRFILCLNSDTLAKPGAIDDLVQLLEMDKDAGAVGPKLVNSDSSLQFQCRRSFPRPMNSFFYFSGLSRLFSRSRKIASYSMSYLCDKDICEVDCLCGAAIMVRREVIENVGLMDEHYHMYGDDIDWCFRIKKAGWKILYDPHAVIMHYGGKGGSNKKLLKNIFEYYRSMVLYHNKHNTRPPYSYLFDILVNIGIWILFASALVRNIFRQTKYIGTKKP